MTVQSTRRARLVAWVLAEESSPRIGRWRSGNPRSQLAGLSPVAHGVKCHVSCDTPRYGNSAGPSEFSTREKRICSDCEQDARNSSGDVRLL